MQTSGLVLDIYDDFQGEVLRSVYPSQDSIPETVKTAQALSSEDRDRLPDDVFALVLMEDGQRMRKFACVDAGNTILATEFFLKNAFKLPEEAQKVAAANLQVARAWYDLPRDARLEKTAFGLQTALTAMNAVPIVQGTRQEIKERLAANSALGQGGHVVTPEERDGMRARMMKSAEVVGTADMPTTAPTGAGAIPSKTVVKKVASVGHLVKGHHGSAPEPDVIAPVAGETPNKLPQATVLRPHVDVSNKKAPTAVTEKKAQVFAVPSEQKYPLDDYAQVKLASEFFDKYSSRMSMETRREYCQNLVPRADELAIHVSHDVRKYASTGYAPDEEIELGYRSRRDVLAGSKTAAMLDALYAERPTVDPDVFCETLKELDKVAGMQFLYGRQIPDPIYSTFGEKVAEAPWSEVIGNDMVTEDDLRRLGRIGQHALKSTFTEEFASEFRKDPVSIFKSLPLDQKKILMRMAVDNSAPGIELTA